MGKVNTTITLEPEHNFYVEHMGINLSKKVREMLDAMIEESDTSVEVTFS